MPVPNTIADLNQAAASNFPLGTDTVGPSLDDYLRAGFAFTRQMFDGTPTFLSSVAGTNTITASSSVPFTAYVAGQTFRFVAAAANTGAATLNINGIGAKDLTKGGSGALTAGDLVAGRVYSVTYDGTRFQLAAVPRGSYLGTQVFTASGTYTPTPGTAMAVVTAIGGGGAGGGAAATGVGALSVGSGGNSGVCGKIIVSSPSATTVTVGAAGAGVVGNAGGAGGTTSFGTLLVCPGGAGGTRAGPSGPPFVAFPPTNSAAASGSGQFVFAGSGQQGAPGIVIANSGSSLIGGAGAPSMFGGGGPVAAATGGGGNASSYGAGGGGALCYPSQPAFQGGAGVPGVVIVDEFA